MALLNSVLVFSMIYIFRRGMPLIEGAKKKGVIGNEEMISVAMMAAISLSGLGGINILAHLFLMHWVFWR